MELKKGKIGNKKGKNGVFSEAWESGRENKGRRRGKKEGEDREGRRGMRWISFICLI